MLYRRVNKVRGELAKINSPYRYVDSDQIQKYSELDLPCDAITDVTLDKVMDEKMSFEGYYQNICKNGHESFRGLWDGDFYDGSYDDSELTCKECGAKLRYTRLIDTTNGIDENDSQTQTAKTVVIGFVSTPTKDIKLVKPYNLTEWRELKDVTAQYHDSSPFNVLTLFTSIVNYFKQLRR